MADTFTARGKMRKPDDTFDIADALITGEKQISIGSSTSYSLAAMVDGTLSDSHYYSLEFTGTPASAVTITVPVSVTRKQYRIKNSTGKTITVKYATGTGVAIDNGYITIVWCDGTNVLNGVPSTSIKYDQTLAELAAGVTPVNYFYPPGNVFRYGAKGDGVTYDHVAIQNAINVIQATGGGGGMVYFPAGTYFIGTKLVLSSAHGVKLKGDLNAAWSGGQWSAARILKAASMTTEAIDIVSAGAIIEQLTCYGEGGNTGNGILIRAPRVSLRDVTVTNMGNDGIRIGTDAGGESCNLWFLENVRSKNNGRHGLMISQGSSVSANANGGTCIHPDIDGNGGNGIELGSCQLNTFVGGAVQTSGVYGAHFSQYSLYNTIIGTDIEASGTKNVIFDTGAYRNAIINQTMASSGIQDAVVTNPLNTIIVSDKTQFPSGVSFPSPAGLIPSKVTLDSYAEGAFTPGLTCGTSGTIALTAPTNTFNVTKTGRRIFFTGTMTVSSVSSPLGSLTMTGLPIAAAADATVTVFVASMLNSPAYTAVQGYIASSTTSVSIRGLNAGAQVMTMAANVQAGSIITISGEYQSAS